MGGNARFGRGPRGFTGPAGGGGFPPAGPDVAPVWFNVGEFSFADFSTDGAVTNIDPYTIPLRGVLHAVLVTPITRFDGAGLTSYTIECGIFSETDRFTSPIDLAITVPGPTVKQLIGMLDQIDQENATDFRITARAEGTGLDGVTAGLFRVDILLSLSPSPAP